MEAITSSSIRASAVTTSQVLAQTITSAKLGRLNGWVRYKGEWISNSGRIASYPGAPFKGQLSKEENERIRRPSQVSEPTFNNVNIRKITLERRSNSGGMSDVYDARVHYSK